MQVAQRRVVEALEDASPNPRDAAHADVAFRVTGLASGHEGMGEHDRTGVATGEVATNPAHCLGEGGLVRARAQPPPGPNGVGVEVGNPVDGDLAVVVAHQDRGADRVGTGADEHTRRVDQLGAEPEALSGVVVAAGDHDLGPRPGQPGERLVGKPDSVDRRQRTVIDVACHHDQIHTLRGDDSQQMVDVRSLVSEHALPVEGPPEMPVGGVEDAHTTNLGEGTDSTANPRRRSAACAPAQPWKVSENSTLPASSMPASSTLSSSWSDEVGSR